MLIVGLGNPGEKYKLNRHNIGFLICDYILKNLNSSNVTKSSFEGELHKSNDFFILKPQTFMNLSGKSVLAVKRFYKVHKVVVFHDDLDLNFGAVKIKVGGSHGGHNGLKSIDESIGADYIRVRIGIGRPIHKNDVTNYVLGDFTKEEQDELEKIYIHSLKIATALQHSNITEVATKFCSKNILSKPVTKNSETKHNH